MISCATTLINLVRHNLNLGGPANPGSAKKKPWAKETIHLQNLITFLIRPNNFSQQHGFPFLFREFLSALISVKNYQAAPCVCIDNPNKLSMRRSSLSTRHGLPDPHEKPGRYYRSKNPLGQHAGILENLKFAWMTQSQRSRYLKTGGIVFFIVFLFYFLAPSGTNIVPGGMSPPSISNPICIPVLIEFQVPAAQAARHLRTHHTGQ